MFEVKIGMLFDHVHAAGVTRWKVSEKDKRYFDSYQCIAIECVEGTHTSINSIGYYNSKQIEEGLKEHIKNRVVWFNSDPEIKENIDKYIEKWHSGEEGIGLELHEYLGVSWDEYQQWVINPS